MNFAIKSKLVNNNNLISILLYNIFPFFFVLLYFFKEGEIGRMDTE